MRTDEAAAAHGFELIGQTREGTRRYTRRSNPYLAWQLTVAADGGADLTWEFSLGQYLLDKGFFVSGQDELSLLLFPREEARGAFSEPWLAEAVGSAERSLGSIDLVTGT